MILLYATFSTLNSLRFIGKHLLDYPNENSEGDILAGRKIHGASRSAIRLWRRLVLKSKEKDCSEVPYGA